MPSCPLETKKRSLSLLSFMGKSVGLELGSTAGRLRQPSAWPCATLPQPRAALSAPWNGRKLAPTIVPLQCLTTEATLLIYMCLLTWSVFIYPEWEMNINHDLGP